MAYSSNLGGAHSGAFLGFALPASLQGVVSAALTDVRRRAGGGDLRLMQPGTWACHLVDMHDTNTPPMRTALMDFGRVSPQLRPFSLTLAGLVGEPNALQPRVVQMGFGGDVAELAHCQFRVMEVFHEFLGTLGEQKFFAGFEVARLKTFNDRSRTDLGRALKMTSFEESASFVVDRVCVLLPEAGPNGPTLKVAQEFLLGGG